MCGWACPTGWHSTGTSCNASCPGSCNNQVTCAPG
jgi:hypothetical protein